jgi:hypothetical protein
MHIYIYLYIYICILIWICIGKARPPTFVQAKSLSKGVKVDQSVGLGVSEGLIKTEKTTECIGMCMYIYLYILDIAYTYIYMYIAYTCTYMYMM